MIEDINPRDPKSWEILRIGEQADLCGSWDQIRRVPGGWVLTVGNEKKRAISAVFIPDHSERPSITYKPKVTSGVYCMAMTSKKVQQVLVPRLN